MREKFLESYLYLKAEINEPWVSTQAALPFLITIPVSVTNSAVQPQPRWWGHFNEWAVAWRAPNEAEEVAKPRALRPPSIQPSLRIFVCPKGQTLPARWRRG